MIRCIKNRNIDLVSYTEVLNQSIQRKIYAYPKYLDTVCGENWDLLVYGDYLAVMPIPFTKKLGFKFIINPKLCQQLGVFSRVDDMEINDKFLHYLLSKYKVKYYAFNDSNSFSKSLLTRRNYIIDTDDYININRHYSPKRRRKLRLDSEVIEFSKVDFIKDFGEVKQFMISNFAGLEKDQEITTYVDIFEKFFKSGSLQCLAFKYKEEIINLIAIYYDEYSVTLLGTFNNREFVKLAGSSYIIDKIIQQNIADKLFDFEGSELPNVEEFFLGFRPTLKPYSCIKNSNCMMIFSFLRNSICSFIGLTKFVH